MPPAARPLIRAAAHAAASRPGSGTPLTLVDLRCAARCRCPSAAEDGEAGEEEEEEQGGDGDGMEGAGRLAWAGVDDPSNAQVRAVIVCAHCETRIETWIEARSVRTEVRIELTG